jgi:hypothetical protein
MQAIRPYQPTPHERYLQSTLNYQGNDDARPIVYPESMSYHPHRILATKVLLNHWFHSRQRPFGLKLFGRYFICSHNSGKPQLRRTVSERLDGLPSLFIVDNLPVDHFEDNIEEPCVRKFFVGGNEFSVSRWMSLEITMRLQNQVMNDIRRLRQIRQLAAIRKIKTWWIRLFWSPTTRVGQKRLLRSLENPDYSVW